jgi:hypothetical protein
MTKPVRNAVCLSILALALGTPGRSAAFDAEAHKRYALRAGTELLKNCGVAFRDALAFADGTEAEDKTQLYRRAMHWHYAERDGPRFVGAGFDSNFNKIFDKRVRDLEAAAKAPSCTRSDIFGKAGRVGHYLQDVRVPAHVIPVHHGGLRPNDGFDGYPFHFDITPLSPAQCQAMATQAASLSATGALRDTRDAITKDTLERLRAPIRPDLDREKCSWTKVFWCNPRERESCPRAAFRGFGSYRDGMVFGESRTFECDGVKKDIGDADYAGFFEKSYAAMMADSASLLLYAKTLADGCDANSPEPSKAPARPRKVVACGVPRKAGARGVPRKPDARA